MPKTACEFGVPPKVLIPKRCPKRNYPKRIKDVGHETAKELKPIAELTIQKPHTIHRRLDPIKKGGEKFNGVGIKS